MMKNIFESARRKYRPARIKFLLIAEAPPKVKSKRFFYFEDVRRYDNLFLETMKVLYPGGCSIIKEVRHQKRKFLERFKNDGFYLIDASDKPMEDDSKARKKRQIEERLPTLIRKVTSLVSKHPKIILLSSMVYKICYNKLKSEGFNVINECAIPLPVGWQKEFRGELSALLRRYGGLK